EAGKAEHVLAARMHAPGRYSSSYDALHGLRIPRRCAHDRDRAREDELADASPQLELDALVGHVQRTIIPAAAPCTRSDSEMRRKIVNGKVAMAKLFASDMTGRVIADAGATRGSARRRRDAAGRAPFVTPAARSSSCTFRTVPAVWV